MYIGASDLSEAERERESVQEEQDVERVTVVRTMSATVKLAKVLDQVVQKAPRSVPWRPCSQPSRRRHGYMDEPRPAKGGAEDTEERVYGMVSRMASSRDKHDMLWRAKLSCSLSANRRPVSW